MTNEIKEILDYLKDDSMFIDDEDGIRKEITLDESNLLLDYITNLQDKLKWYENIDPNKTIDKFRYEQNMKVKNLQERIDKAVEYIEENWHKSFLLGTWEFFGSGDELLNILRGDE
jgi:hypothetical protein